jgi:hypothetical protein
MEEVHSTIKLTGKLYLTGYSEGGHATLALQWELESSTGENLPALEAVGCGASPHSPTKVVTDKLLQPKRYPQPYFAPHMLVTIRKEGQERFRPSSIPAVCSAHPTKGGLCHPLLLKFLLGNQRHEGRVRR